MRYIIQGLFFLFSFNVYAQQSGWSVYTSWPHGHTIRAVSAINEQNVVAAGQSGIIIRTNDGGQTWWNTYFSTMIDFTDIHFIDSQNGWIIGEGEIYRVLKTTDGGVSWEDLDAPANFLKAVYFVSPTVGWAIGLDGYPYKTTDGGYSWIDPGVMLGGCHDLFFVDADTGWAVTTVVTKFSKEDVGMIYKTTNGGTVWSSQFLPFMNGANAVHFTSPLIGIVVGPNGGIARTTNGGQTWYNVPSGVAETLYSVDFADAQNGWIVGEQGAILYTNDGGESWSSQTANVTTRLHGVSCASATTVWSVGYAGTIIKTTDGGAVWLKINRSLLNDGNFYSLSFPTETNGWALATDWEVYQDKIFRTTDGGQTWYQAIYFGGSEMIDLFSTDEQHCWTVGLYGNYHYTTDGGTTWQDGNAGATPYLNSVFFINNTTGWTCGSGNVYKTLDGGMHWFNVSPGSLADCYAVYFINENTGWLAASLGSNNPVIMKTTNGGMNWFSQTLPANTPNIADVKFSDAMNGFAVGYNSVILRTTNGGDTWIKEHGGTLKQTIGQGTNPVRLKGRIYDPITKKFIRSEKSGPKEQNLFLSAIAQQNEVTWVAVGDEGTILKSTDGGDEWFQEPSGTIEELYDVTFPTSGSGWAAGEYGTLLKYYKEFAPEPEAQPTNLQFSDIKIRGFRVQFDHAYPAVDGYIAIRRKGAAPDFIPVDGQFYYEGMWVGENKVTYIGNENSFIEKALLPNQEYFYQIYSYNGSDDQVNYRTVNPLQGSQATLFSNAIMVTSVDDSTPGCLRFAIDSANNRPGADTILFALYFGAGLAFLSELPPITDDFTFIDGDMDEDGLPDITLSGYQINYATLLVNSSYNTIKSLIINSNQSDTGAALMIWEGNHNKITGNYIGTDNNGIWPIPNKNGIIIYNGSYNQIGNGTASGRNVISSNYTAAIIRGEYSRFNEIRGNYIGLNATGTEPLPNAFGVVLDEGSSYNTIGSHDPGGRNLFSNFEDPDVFIPASVLMLSDGTDSNYVLGNWFGLNAAGETVGGMGGVGLYMGAKHNFIGDGTAEGRNIIAGHFAGIVAMESDSNTILGNYLGTGPDGMTPAMNYFGIMINGSGNTIGDNTDGGRNIISGNMQFALGILGGNLSGIGPKAPPILSQPVFQKFRDQSRLANFKIAGKGSKSNHLLDKFKAAYLQHKNIESAGEANHNRISGNYIGVAADGITPLNNENNIVMDTDSDNDDPVTENLFDNNIISNSAGNGIQIEGNINIKQNRFYANSIYNNQGFGIFIETPSQQNVWPPNIMNYDTLTHILSGNAAAGALVQIYTDYGDEGKIFLDTVYADENGNWSKMVMPFVNMNFTALQDSAGNTSAFSEPFSSGLTDPLLVTSADDNSDLGTLRYAMLYANMHSGPDVIRFALPAGSVIHLTDVLPVLYDNGTTIDGDLGANGTPDIVIKSNETIEGSIIYITSSNNIIKGLVLQNQNFPNHAAITIDGGHYNTVIGCYIGTDIYGLASAQNYCGVKITSGAMFNQIGDGTASGRNVISGNRDGIGVMITEEGTRNNKVFGNYIGLNAFGTDSLPNRVAVFIASSARHNIIGGHGEEERNLIYAYEPPGQMAPEFTSGAVMITGNETDSNYVIGNWFGLNANATPLSVMDVIGVSVTEDAAYNFIGDGQPGGGNVIANGVFGVLFHYADSNFVYGNRIGTDPAGNSAIPNQTGVVIRKSSYNQIGGADPLQRNVISGNSLRGVEIISNNMVFGKGSLYNTITGNYIGIKADGVSPLANSENGLFFESEIGYPVVFNNAIDNVIAHNGAYGLSFNGAFTNSNSLFRNLIYNNAYGGIFIDSVAQNNILPPVIDSIVGYTVYGSGALQNAQIQVYYDEGNQGKYFIDTTQEENDGYWSFVLPDTAINYGITALQTYNNTTSAFSAPVPFITPVLSVSPNLLDFGDVYFGNNGILPVTLKAMNGTVAINDFTFTGSNSFSLLDTVNFPVYLQANEGVVYHIRFSPGSIGADSAVLLIANNTIFGTKNVNLYGTGIKPVITANMSVISFGHVQISQFRDTVLTIQSDSGSVILDTALFKTGLPFTATLPTFPKTLQMGDSVNIPVRFSPVVAGDYDDTLLFFSNSGINPLAIALSGTGFNTGVTAAPNPLTFGSVQVTQTASDTVILKPVGGTVILNGASSLSGPFSATLPAFPKTLNIGDSLKLPIRFTPTAAGTFSDTLRIMNNSNAGELKIAMSGTGFNTGVTAAPNPLTFGFVQVTQTASDTVILKPVGGTVILNGASSLSGPFSVTVPPFPKTLNIGDSLKLPIRFTPAAAGNYNDTLRIFNNSDINPLIITMNGTAFTTAITAVPNPLSFAAVQVSQSSSDTVILKPVGGTVILNGASSLSGAFSATLPAFPKTLNIGDSLKLPIRFTPTAAGTFSDTLRIMNNSNAGELKIAMSGTGIQNAGQLVFSDNGSHHFGVVRIGDSLQTTVTLTAVDAPVTVSQIVQGIGGATDFLILNFPNLPQVLAAGASISLPILFKPLNAGALSDTIKVYSDAANGSQLYFFLSGTGQSNNTPNPFALKPVGTNNMTNDRTPDFFWQDRGDPDGDALTYILEVSKLSDFAAIAYRDTTTDTTLTVSTQLDSIGAYYWRVTAQDGWGGARTSNTGFFRIDAVPANLTAGTFFSSVLKPYISINVISSKLMRTVNASIGLRNAANLSVDSTTKALDLESAANRFYQTPYKLTSPGQLFLTITGTDSAQNVTIVRRNYQISSIVKNQALILAADQGRWQITAPARTFADDGFLMVNELDHETKRVHGQSVMTIAKIADPWTTVGEGLNIQGSAPIRSGQGLVVTMTYPAEVISGLQARYTDFDERKIGLYFDHNGEWIYIGGEGRNGQVQAKVRQYGLYKLMYNPDHEFLPTKVELAQNYPNPFNPATTIRFGIPQEGKVNLVIYNILGQKVKELVNDTRAAGYYNVIWNGRNDKGNPVSSGVYLYRLETPMGVKTRKLLLVK